MSTALLWNFWTILDEKVQLCERKLTWNHLLYQNSWEVGNQHCEFGYDSNPWRTLKSDMIYLAKLETGLFGH